jgi:outer membrane protein assembly factor BamD
MLYTTATAAYMSNPINMLRSLLPVLVACALLGASACAGSARDSSGGAVTYSVSAKQNYDKGMKALENEEWMDAAKYFAFVKARFPYSKFAVLADLRVADAAFGAGAYLEAIDSYKQFIKFHPTHEMVENGYASFRIGESYFKMLPDDWFLIPPSYEKDQTSALDAMRELTTFQKKYPKSPYFERSEKMRRLCARKLASHEWYVARFYWDRNRPMGTVLRLRTLLDRYGGVGYDEQALLLLGKAYWRVGRRDDAKRAWQHLVDKYPRARQASEARMHLSSHGGPAPVLTPAPAPAKQPAPAPAPPGSK